MYLTDERLAEIVFSPLAEIAEWLKSVGLEAELTGDTLLIHNPHLALTTGLTAGTEPPTKAVCLGFALAGAFWPQVFPRLLTLVNRRWQAQRQPSSPRPGQQLTKPFQDKFKNDKEVTNK